MTHRAHTYAASPLPDVDRNRILMGQIASRWDAANVTTGSDGHPELAGDR